jgi:hypothetical protein
MFPSSEVAALWNHIWASPEAIFWAVWELGKKKKPAPVPWERAMDN